MLEKIKSTLRDEKFQKAVVETVATIVIAVTIKVVVNAAANAIGNGIEAWKESHNEIAAE